MLDGLNVIIIVVFVKYYYKCCLNVIKHLDPNIIFLQKHFFESTLDTFRIQPTSTEYVVWVCVPKSRREYIYNFSVHKALEKTQRLVLTDKDRIKNLFYH